MNFHLPRGQEIFRQLARRADVILQNFRPGALDKRGVGYDALAAINPRVIWCSISAYGRVGPLAGHPGYDPVLQARTGIMSMTGFPDGPPTRVGTALSDLCGGVFMFCGLASALYAREKTGKGSHVDVAMFDATLLFLEDGLMEVAAYGKPVNRIGNPPSRFFVGISVPPESLARYTSG